MTKHPWTAGRKRLAAVTCGAAVVAGCGTGGTATPTTTPTTTAPRAGLVGGSESLPSGALAFRVPSAGIVTTPVGDIRPGPGEALVDARIVVENRGERTVKPFCVGDGGRVVVDPQGRNYTPESGSMMLTDECAAIPPGGEHTFRQVFRVTDTVTAFQVALWDPDAPGDPVDRFVSFEHKP